MTDAGTDAQRTLRHEAKNLLNALRLNMEVLYIVEADDERLECLDAVEEIADQFEAWVGQFEQFCESAPGPDPA